MCGFSNRLTFIFFKCFFTGIKHQHTTPLFLPKPCCACSRKHNLQKNDSQANIQVGRRQLSLLQKFKACLYVFVLLEHDFFFLINSKLFKLTRLLLAIWRTSIRASLRSDLFVREMLPYCKQALFRLRYDARVNLCKF